MKTIIVIACIGTLGVLFLFLQSPVEERGRVTVIEPIVVTSDLEEEENVSGSERDAEAEFVRTGKDTIVSFPVRSDDERRDEKDDNEVKGVVLVTRVVDGDTIEIEWPFGDTQGKREKVRYIGVNTPESVDPRRTVQCFGKEASAYNKELVLGKRVRLEADVEDRDKYGRLLRYVWIGETMINEQLVADGYAQLMTIPPNVKYVERFKAAQTKAREAKRGLWSTCKKGA